MKDTTKHFFSRYQSQHLLLTIVAAIAVLLFFTTLAPFFETICMAAIFSLGIFTLIEKLRRRLGKTGTPPLSLLLTSFGLLYAVIGTLFTVSLLKLYDNFLGSNKESTRTALQQISQYGTEKMAYVKPYFESWLKIFGVQDVSYDSALQSLPATVFGGAAAFISHIPAFIIQSVVFAAMMLFFFYSHKGLYRLALRVRPFASEDVDHLCQVLKRSSYESIMANAIVGVLQATIVTIGAAIFGFSEWSLIFSITFIFAFIPVIGGSSVSFLMALLCLVTNNYTGAIGMTVVGGITGISDNILRSYLLSSEQQTSSLLCFVSIIGAVSIFGFSGLFIGPFVINMAAQLMPHLFPKRPVTRRLSARRTIIKDSQQKSSMA